LVAAGDAVAGAWVGVCVAREANARLRKAAANASSFSMNRWERGFIGRDRGFRRD
jgi:hypothetical protein